MLIYSVTGIGALVFVYSAIIAFDRFQLGWVYLACLTAVAGFFPVRLPFLRGKFQAYVLTVSDVFVYASILLFSPEVAVLVVVTDGIVASVRLAQTRRLYRIFFNVSQLAVVHFIVGHVFYALMATSPPLEPERIDNLPFLFLNLGFCALLSFILNSGAVALAIALVTGESFRDIWKENFLWASLTNIAGASTAAIIFLNFDRQVLAFGIAIPIVLVIYYAYKMNLDRIKQALQHIEEMDVLFHSTITSLAMAIDAKDQGTHGHVQRVQALTLGLARHCGIRDDSELKGLRAAALLHDIGKLAIPEHILNKPGQLTDAEIQKMRIHPVVGADILDTVPFPYPVTPYVRYHHERWDGTGYPDGLKGEDIPLGARILSIVDCYDALRSDRPYRPKLSKEIALEYIRQEAGKAYDPRIVDVLDSHIEDLEAQIEEAEAHVPQALLQQIEETTGQGAKPERSIKRVFQDIAATHKEVEAVYEISKNLGSSLSVTETMNLLSSRIKRFVPYSACAIYLVNPSDDRVIPHFVTGMYKDILDGVEGKLGEGVTGWVAANNKSLMNVSPGPDFPNLKLLRAVFKSCLSVPLALESSLVGVITLYSNNENVYHHDHLRLMETISPHAASAINNAVIYQETQEDAFSDPLTGLPNLRHFNAFIEEELKRADRVSYPVTLLMLDLDEFKEVNDQFGHRNGDRVLIEIAHVLRSQMRRSDTCVRYGGDEFVAVLPEVSKEMAVQTIERIQSALDRHSVMVDEHQDIRIGISIGAATFPEDGRESEALLGVADRAMYRNKVQRDRKKDRRGAVLPFEKRNDPA